MSKVDWSKLIGKKFNSLEILNIIHKPDKNGDLKPYAECKCDCGKTSDIYVYNVIKGLAKTCGCGRRTSPETTVGSVYGRLTVIAEVDTGDGVKKWKCKCECGNEGVYTQYSLRRHKRTTCGQCVPFAKPGERYGHLTVLEDLGVVWNKTNSYKIHGMRCKCDCGNEKIVANHHLKSGTIISCGCMTALKPKDPRSDNPLIKRLHHRSERIIDRCRNYASPLFYYYGGRGIKCELGEGIWDVAESLSKVPGYFEGAQIDRIDNDGNYTLFHNEHGYGIWNYYDEKLDKHFLARGNLRWVNNKENTANSTVIIHMTKNELASRLISKHRIETHVFRITKDLNEFEFIEFSDIPAQNKPLYLCVHKSLNLNEHIDKIRTNYSNNGYDIPNKCIKRVKIKIKK